MIARWGNCFTVSVILRRYRLLAIRCCLNFFGTEIVAIFDDYDTFVVPTSKIQVAGCQLMRFQ